MYVCMYVCMSGLPATVEGSDEQVVPVVRTVFLFTSIAFFLEKEISAFIYSRESLLLWKYVRIYYVCNEKNAL